MIPADVVTSARALRDRLADPAQLAAYKTKLPTDVVMTVGVLGMPAILSFDADGNPVANAW